MTQIREVYEGLANYRVPVAPPVNVVAPQNNPRLPLKRPIDSVPGMPSPVSTSSKTVKKTNVQIPMARRVFREPMGPGGLLYDVQEGDIVFSCRGPGTTVVDHNGMIRFRPTPPHGFKTGIDCPVTVRTIESINKEIGVVREMPYAITDDLFDDPFPFELDGVVNNLDDADPYNEFREPPIANVAVQGPVRLDNRSATQVDSRLPSIRSVIYVALETVEVEGRKAYKHRLKRFSSAMVTRGDYDFMGAASLDPNKPFGVGGTQYLKDDDPWKTEADKNLFGAVVKIWRVGHITDSNQSPKMLTVNVDHAVYTNAVETDIDRYNIDYQLKDDDDGGKYKYVLRWKKEADGKLVPEKYGDEVFGPNSLAWARVMMMWDATGDFTRKFTRLFNAAQERKRRRAP